MTPPGQRLRTRLAAVFLTATPLVASAPALARTWLIAEDGTGDAPTIQAGIESTAAGDTVFALPGRFVENIDFLGKAIVVKGSGMGVSIIDGSGQPESCVRLQSGEDRESILEGFTVQGGSGSCPGTCNFGGGVYIYNSSPTIRGNLVTGNNVSDSGAGIVCTAPNFVILTPLIEENHITQNFAAKNAGGIAVVAGSAPIIRNNVIEGNEATDGDGGGIWIWVNTDGALITGNEIMNNVAGDHGGGIHAARNTGSRPPVRIEISHNTIVDNLSRAIPRFSPGGGGLRLNSVEAWIHHNTIARNEAQGPDSTWGGGGISVDASGGSLIEQNIIALSTFGGGIRCIGSSIPTFRDNLAWMNVGGNGSGQCADWTQGDGNLVANPYFCGPEAGEYSLAENSPALTHPAGPLGAYPQPGCGPAAVKATTWGRLKARYGW